MFIATGVYENIDPGEDWTPAPASSPLIATKVVSVPAYSGSGWTPAPAGKNSGKVPVSTNGTFYFRIESKGGEEVQLPDLPTRQVCTNPVHDSDYFYTYRMFDICDESSDATVDTYEMRTFYEVNAADFSNAGSVGVYCTDDKCNIMQAGNPKLGMSPIPVDIRDCSRQYSDPIHSGRRSLMDGI